MKFTHRTLRIALLASVLLGAADIHDTDRRKLPLIAMATILGMACLCRTKAP